MSFFSLLTSHWTAANPGAGVSSSDHFQKVIIGLVTRHLAKNSKVLDLGAGSGLFSALLTQNGYEVTSADLFPERCSVPCLDVDLNTDFSASFANDFDAICCLETIEHVENPRSLLRQCNKILKPGGMLFISTPDVSGIYSRVKFFFTGEFAMFNEATYRTIGHITPISHWQMIRMLKETELEIMEQIDYDGSFGIPRTAGDAVKLVSRCLRPVLAGHIGWQVMAFACRKSSAVGGAAK
jgi:2-polyprenyl-3-methyl-5-hydroxy-6-metoxy-1,4-benzoquinol methylase